jgi:subtilase family serine protease
MNRFVIAAWALAASVLCWMVAASAANVKVERSGNVYYTSVCGKTLQRLHANCTAKIVTDSAGAPLSSAQPPIGGLTATDLRDAYKIDTDGDSSTIIAIVDAYGYDNAESDLAVYRAQFGLPPCTTDNGCFKKLNQQGQEGGYPKQDIHWAEESALDLDMASAMCPNCKLYLIEATTNQLAALGFSENTAASLGAHVISNSYAGGEAGSQPYETRYYDHPGIAVTASTGDNGYEVLFPASSPHVIAVGGTHLVRDGSSRGWSETVWKGAGSGCSALYEKPAWQTDTGCTNRMVGDVAADADPATGAAVYGPNSNGVSTWLVLGGTSLAAPLVGGIFGNNAGKVNAASTAYKKPKKRLFDIKSGSNGVCSPAYFCNGEKGYDGPTGNGTPNGIAAFGK